MFVDESEEYPDLGHPGLSRLVDHTQIFEVREGDKPVFDFNKPLLDIANHNRVEKEIEQILEGDLKPATPLDELIAKEDHTEAYPLTEEDLMEAYTPVDHSWRVKHGIITQMDYEKNLPKGEPGMHGNACSYSERATLTKALDWTLGAARKSMRNYSSREFTRWFGRDNNKQEDWMVKQR